MFSQKDSERPKIIIVIKNNIDGDGDENDDYKIVYDDTDHGDCTTKTNNHDNENTDGDYDENEDNKTVHDDNDNGDYVHNKGNPRAKQKSR